jgi:hypothetical protein
VEVDLYIHEKVKCIEVDLASDYERKISTSYFQRTISIAHNTHFLGKLLVGRIIGHVPHKTHIVEL